MRAPTSTYRLQITPTFTLDDACGAVPVLAGLGVSHLYLSPLLQAASGSTHGYDVVDHGRIDAARGGIEGLRRLADTAHDHGLGLVLDIVPNHMSVRVPHQNAAWWDVLRLGRTSPYARWFDIDWDAGPLLLPILGSDDDVAKLSVAGDELRYYEHRFPCAPGSLGGTAQEVHARQAYRLVDWRRGSADLTYRRFFDVTDLAGLRVEDDAVFDATHALVIDLVRDGVIDGLRIDHPDGLADPGGYLARLRERAPVWTVVEKILEPGEVLPDTWPCAGTTGYDAARLVTGSFVDPSGRPALERLWQEHGGTNAAFGELVLEAKAAVTQQVLAAEVARLDRLAPDVGAATLADVLARFPVYRSYLPEFGRAYLDEALAGRSIPRLTDAADPLCVRFQQTSGMVMAKGVEDTAFYRYHVLDALNEVGSDPGAFGVSAAEWHHECLRLERDWPETMTLLSTHDSKRSEDVRARLVLLSQDPDRWERAVRALDAAAAPHVRSVAPEDVYLLHQTLCGTGPIAAERVGDYMRKATREAKRHTSWLDPDEAYDADLQSLVQGVLADGAYLSALADLHRDWDRPWRRTVLAQKLLQLSMPGVPDLYQGSERELLTLVDPDNRRDVDFTPLGGPDSPKTALVRTVLGLRRDRPDLFRDYAPIDVGPHALAFHRSDTLVVVAVTRAMDLQRNGFGDVALDLGGRWTDVLTGRPLPGDVRLADAVPDGPGLVLMRH
ncbi:MAG TPA: malto-oligosyltrehalose synthase [Mycobacteriales bacterium]